MNKYGLDFHGELLLEEYQQQLAVYQRLRDIVTEKLQDIITQSGLEVNTMESRIKKEASLAGKLVRKAGKYTSLLDITDILGARIITYYNEDVDRIASMVESVFEIDWANSVDKRKMHEFNSFGYNSLHYICRMPPEVFHDPQQPELNQIPFELQMRTALQHVWSAIQHDIGYKTEIETPMEFNRSLSRLAGMLELVDDEFSRIRNAIADYRRKAQSLIQSGKLEDISLDADTFRSYLNQHPFDKLNRKIAAITQAEIYEVDQMRFLLVLRHLGFKTLGDVEQMKKDHFDDAYQLALSQLSSTDIDILAETIGLQNLCTVHLLKQGGGKADLKKLFDLINGTIPQNEVMADFIMSQARRLSFMNK